MSYQGMDTEPEQMLQFHPKFRAFMDVFGTRLAVIYSLFCALLCSVFVVTSYYLSPSGAIVSTVSIAWMGVFFIIGISNLFEHLREPIDSVWEADFGSRDVDVVEVAVPPLASTMAVVFIVCANLLAMFTIAVDRCVDVGGSPARGRVLFGALFADYVCLFAYTCNKWSFVVKQPGQTQTIELEMPSNLRQQLVESAGDEPSRRRGDSQLGSEQAELDSQRERGESILQKPTSADFSTEPRGRSASAIDREHSGKAARTTEALVEAVNQQLRSRMPQQYATDDSGYFMISKNEKGKIDKTKQPNTATNQYWALKKHEDRVLQQQGIEKSTCGKFVFKDGKVIVCFNENNEKNHGKVAITKDGKTEDQVTPESSVLQTSKHCSLVAQ